MPPWVGRTYIHRPREIDDKVGSFYFYFKTFKAASGSTCEEFHEFHYTVRYLETVMSD